MSWHRIRFDNNVKTHIVHESMVNAVVEDLRDRHSAFEISRSAAESILFDLGGVFQLNRENMSFDIDGLRVDINEQHIWGLSPCIERSARMRAGGVKINIPQIFDSVCMIMPVEMYNLFIAQVEQLNQQYDAKHNISNDGEAQ
jgi:hypothetical protein